MTPLVCPDRAARIGRAADAMKAALDAAAAAGARSGRRYQFSKVKQEAKAMARKPWPLLDNAIGNHNPMIDASAMPIDKMLADIERCLGAARANAARGAMHLVNPWWVIPLKAARIACRWERRFHRWEQAREEKVAGIVRAEAAE